jgi:hypothetical protein
MKRTTPLLILVVFASLLAGCRSLYPKAATSGNMPEETITFYLGPVLAPRAELAGHIVTTSSPDTNQPITIVVGGAVNQPGEITVPKGTIMLGAIKQAGGFHDIAFCRRVKIIRGTSTYAYRLSKEPLRPDVPGHYRIWYGGGRSDAVLEPGDIVLVPRTL